MLPPKSLFPRLRWPAPLTALVGLTLAAAQAQEPLTPPPPISTAAARLPEGPTLVALNAAQRAQDLAMPSVAVDVYRSYLDKPGVDRRVLSLALATALLDAGQAAEAEKTLDAIAEPRDAAWQLRAGLAALQLRKRDVAQAAHDTIRVEELTPADLPWYYFLKAALYDTAPVREMSRANQFYVAAETAATTELSRARFQMTAEQVRLRDTYGTPSEAELKVSQDNYERNKGTAFGYDAAETHAAKLAAADRRPEAITFLERVLAQMPAHERAARDRLRLILGLVADRGRNPAGRVALMQLLENGHTPERQRQALQLLAAASRQEPLRRQFRDDLTRLIAAKPPHPILESLLFYRAQLALHENDFATAEDAATTLLKQFPMSTLRVHTYGILTQSAWEQRRYRNAAHNARLALEEIKVAPVAPPAPVPPGTTAPPSPAAAVAAALRRARVDFGVLQAEAWFRSGDWRNAADAYAGVLRDRPPEMDRRKVADLMFQRVLAEIKTGSADVPVVLDELERDPAFDTESRWHAEWEYARALLVRGGDGTRQAYARIEALLRDTSPGASSIEASLRARMAWLQTKLSLANGEPQRTIELANGFVQANERLGLDAQVKDQIASMMIQLKATAELSLGREADGLATLKRLREQYPRTDAAVSSYLLEAGYFAAPPREKIDEARKALVALTDNEAYKDSEYLPFALYQLAGLSEQLGREENLREANKRIEELVKRPAADGQPDLYFMARVKQGDILRKLNDFPRAQLVYEELVNKFPRRPDIVVAQLRLAETHNALSAATSSAATASAGQDRRHIDAALSIFAQLHDRVDAPADVRVEAGYNLGLLLVRLGKVEEAVTVWWTEVAQRFLVNAAAPFEQDAKRPYWLARTLIELGRLQEQRGRMAEARAAYELVMKHRLPLGEAVAKARLEQLAAAPTGQIK